MDLGHEYLLLNLNTLKSRGTCISKCVSFSVTKGLAVLWPAATWLTKKKKVYHENFMVSD